MLALRLINRVREVHLVRCALPHHKRFHRVLEVQPLLFLLLTQRILKSVQNSFSSKYSTGNDKLEKNNPKNKTDNETKGLNKTQVQTFNLGEVENFEGCSDVMFKQLLEAGHQATGNVISPFLPRR